MIRTVTLPHLHFFGITDGLELQVSNKSCSHLTPDQEAGSSTTRRRTGDLQVPCCAATKNTAIYGKGQNQADKRCRVSPLYLHASNPLPCFPCSSSLSLSPLPPLPHPVLTPQLFDPCFTTIRKPYGRGRSVRLEPIYS